MCLAAGSLKTPKKTAGFGWKVVLRTKKQILTPHFKRRLRVDLWHKAKERPIPTYNWTKEETYLSGFHIFKTKTAAKKYARTNVEVLFELPFEVIKVEYRGAHTEGLDGMDKDLPVIVAREMRILPPSEVS